tara:strand:+ start:5639 stop:5836 length:198 start_codon:yes stop_codon:yes gene_type:complete
MKQREKNQLEMEQRDKIIDCADGIVDYITEQMIMPRVFEDFGHELEAEEYENISNKVYQQIKLRM